MSERTYFAPCPKGLAPILAAELASLGAQWVQAGEAGCQFAGSTGLAMRVNLESRIASRVLMQVASTAYQNEEQIYAAARALPWHQWFAVERTIKVEMNAQRSPVKSLDFTTLRIKDAVCDAFRAATGARPSVAVREPDIRVHAFLDPNRATLYLDTSGEPLFKRGSREHVGPAPLKKNLAAGILKLSGWAPGTPFLDPMCGSGTFLVEAAEIALQRAPGLGRRFAFEHLTEFDAGAWRTLTARARERVLAPTKLAIYGSDKFGYALDDARANLAAQGLGDCVQLKQANVLEISAPASEGIWVTNPPYGVRLDEQDNLAALYPKLADVLKQKFAGWTAYFFSGDARLPKSMRLAASKKIPLFNGKLDCRLYEYKLVAGSNRR